MLLIASFETKIKARVIPEGREVGEEIKIIDGKEVVVKNVEVVPGGTYKADMS